MLERAGARSAEHHSPLPVGNRRNVASQNASRSPAGERRGQALPAMPKSVHAAAWMVEIAAPIECARTQKESPSRGASTQRASVVNLERRHRLHCTASVAEGRLRLRAAETCHLDSGMAQLLRFPALLIRPHDPSKGCQTQTRAPPFHAGTPDAQPSIRGARTSITGGNRNERYSDEAQRRCKEVV